MILTKRQRREIFYRSLLQNYFSLQMSRQNILSFWVDLTRRNSLCSLSVTQPEDVKTLTYNLEIRTYNVNY